MEVRILLLDTYVNTVPILRLFGLQRNGTKVCAHIHGLFPYLYIALDASLDIDSKAELERLLNKAAETKVVHRITQVYAVPFYGYHAKPHHFARIELLDPNAVPLLVTSFQGTASSSLACIKQVRQPIEFLESHYPFRLQVMMDYDLWGMNFVTLHECKERLMSQKRTSRCAIEVDARLRKPQSPSHGIPSLKELWDTIQRKGDNIASMYTPTPESQGSSSQFEAEVVEFKTKLLDRLQIEKNGSMELEDMLEDLSQCGSQESDGSNWSFLEFQPPPDELVIDSEEDERDIEESQAELTQAYQSMDQELEAAPQAPEAEQSGMVCYEVRDQILLPHVQLPLIQHVVQPARPAPLPSTEPRNKRKKTPRQQQVNGNRRDGQFLTLLCTEVLCQTTGDRLPDPKRDAVLCICVSVYRDHEPCEGYPKHMMANTELDLFSQFIDLVHATDPDFLIGFETEQFSFGYLQQRFAQLKEQDLGRRLSRVVHTNCALTEYTRESSWEKKNATGMYVKGRVMINSWRVIRSATELRLYSFHNCVKQVLDQRIPKVSDSMLFQWFASENSTHRRASLRYLKQRVSLTVEMLLQIDFFTQTSEFARLYGILFSEVYTRGSQFRVESIMVRLAHQEGFLVASPTPQDVRDQPPLESLPLVMEPRGEVYWDPVAVLDFRSLYPSIIISRNMCFSTCIGRIDRLGWNHAPRSLGTGNNLYPIDKTHIQRLIEEDHVWVAPTGVAFLKASYREGILPRMLREILDVRVTVKAAMKSGNDHLYRILNVRQMALKLIANVTYGYTSASYSGRMPCAEIADSIVETGRRALETCIKTVNCSSEWKAEVVYGDTDSIFVHFPGATRQQAFASCARIAEQISRSNPSPMKLQVEKVYQPCALITKKRYVGWAYEHPLETEPRFDDKGIETVRRDACPLVARQLRKSINLLFSNKVNEVRSFLTEEWYRMLAGKCPLDEFIFSKKVRLGTYKGPTLPPSAIVAQKLERRDPCAAALFAQRVSYVVVYGPPGSRLVDLVVPPQDVIQGKAGHVNYLYYITKQSIPVLNRVFMLVGIDTGSWFNAMQRPRLPPPRFAASGPKVTIDHYFASNACSACAEKTHITGRSLCISCLEEPDTAALLQAHRSRRIGSQLASLDHICRQCTRHSYASTLMDIVCDSIECPVFCTRGSLLLQLPDSHEDS